VIRAHRSDEQQWFGHSHLEAASITRTEIAVRLRMQVNIEITRAKL